MCRSRSCPFRFVRRHRSTLRSDTQLQFGQFVGQGSLVDCSTIALSLLCTSFTLVFGTRSATLVSRLCTSMGSFSSDNIGVFGAHLAPQLLPKASDWLILRRPNAVERESRRTGRVVCLWCCRGMDRQAKPFAIFSLLRQPTRSP